MHAQILHNCMCNCMLKFKTVNNILVTFEVLYGLRIVSYCGHIILLNSLVYPEVSALCCYKRTNKFVAVLLTVRQVSLFLGVT